MAIGAGLTFGADAFNVKARLGAVLDTNDDTTTISVGILPSYKVDDVTIFLQAGLGMVLSSADPVMSWFINPYITMPAGNLRFFAGFQLWQRDSGSVNYALPFGFNISF
jgi:hypothetical protein